MAAMKASRIKPPVLTRIGTLGLVLTLNFALVGCAYRLPASMLPSQQRLRIAAPSPEAYILRSRIREARDYRVPSDGRVTLDVPAYRAACSVYLFDILRIHRGTDPFTERTIDVVGGGKRIRQLSLKEISGLPLDSEGYHLLTIRAAR